MKRFLSCIFALMMLMSLAACSGGKLSQEEIENKIASGDVGTIQGHYSVRNEKDGKGDFYIQFNSALETFDYYADDGTLVKFYGDEVVYDKSGNEVPRSEIPYGQSMIIYFDGVAVDDDPVTIKAYKIVLSD